MARSHHRPKKHHPQQTHVASAKPKRKGVTVITIFMAVFGMLLGYLIGGITIMIVGLILGVAVGYFLGSSIS